MPNVDTLMAGLTPKYLSTFGKPVQARYYPDAGGGTYKTMTVILEPLQNQHLDTGSTELQYIGQLMQFSTRNDTEGQTTIVCHGDRNNVGGGDKVAFSEDGFVLQWNVQEVLMNRAGMAQVRIINNPGAIE